jgi:tetratricopeptide (TPR) repeat protein
MEIFGQDWPEELPGWESLAGETAIVSRSAVTQQLDSLMKTQAMQQRPSRRYRWILLALAGTFLLGMVLARFAVTVPYLLADAKSNPGDFPEYPNVKQQWYYASKYGTEGAWKSIEKYFPKEGYFVDRANQQLALLFLKEGNYDKAMDIFEKFTYRGDGERELRAFGLAGQSVVLSYQDNYAESTNILIYEYLPLSNSLNNPQMDRYVQEAFKRNSSKRDSPATEKE